MSKLRGIITLALLSCFVVATWGCDFQKQTLPKPKVVRKKIVAPKTPTALARNSAQSASPAVTVAKVGKRIQAAPVVKRISTAELRPKSDIAATPASRKAPPMVAKNSTAPVTASTAISQPKVKMPPEVTANKATTASAEQPAAIPEVKRLPPEMARPQAAPSATNAVAQEKPATEAVPSSAAVIQPATAPLTPEPDTIIPTDPAATVAAVNPAVKKGATTVAMQKGAPVRYNPQGRINPFEPLFKDEPEAPPVTAKKKRRVPRTPLERIDIGQLKLVGIIMASSGNRALVQEASGKGYIIKEGTFIGLHSGKVTDIKKDRVVIEEETDEVAGTQKIRNKELVLPKPPGE